MSTVDDLVKQVQQLENATTDLLDATNVSKQTLDEAVDSATGSAGSAKTDAATATTAKNEAVTARNESVAARDEAEAIAYEGEATTEPGGGKIPVAYADGQIDSGWLPEFRARFPYSGVIGSINKGDLFRFAQSDSDANKIYWQPSTQYHFNIAGRLVKFTSSSSHASNIIATLPEAEDTADRAIAFDDIFLDWNGNIDTYRSITPHRTSTGYDADAIASEHGYSKVSNGLHKTGDTYALLLGRVARRNKGAYHPLWNPEGTGSIRNSAGSGNSGPWWASYVKGIDQSEQCFSNDFTALYWGSIGESNQALKGRPNKENYDAIYADDFTPLYYSAQNIIDRQALLFDSFNRAVSGETFMGAEGTGIGYQYTCYAHEDNNRRSLFQGAAGIVSSSRIDNCCLVIINLITGETIPNNDIYFWSNRNTFAVYNDDVTISLDDQIILIPAPIHRAKFNTKKHISARPQFLALDIIGALGAMPQEWLDNGLPGNWLAVGEEGEDLIPDGTEKNFKASRKCLELYSVIARATPESNWVDNTSLWRTYLESSANGRTVSFDDGYVALIFYRTASNPFELGTRLPVMAIGDCHGSNSANVYQPLALIGSNLIGKIPTHDDHSSEYVPMLGMTRTLEAEIYRDIRLRPRHEPFEYLKADANSPAYKALPTLAKSTNNVHILQVNYKEMRYNGTAWGDDNKFEIVDNQFSVTDINGEQVIVGQKRCALPYHFDGVTYG